MSRAMPHRSLVPNSSLCIPRSDAAASGRGRNALPDDPSHGKTKRVSALYRLSQHAAMANAMRCMGTCTALRFRGQNCGALTAADRGSESQAVPMPEERLPLHHHLRRPGWAKAVTGQKKQSAPPHLPHLPRKTGIVRRWSKLLQWPLLPHLPRKTGMVPRWDKHPARSHLLA